MSLKKYGIQANLEGRTAIITGAARGIGFAIAEALATSGATVAIIDVLEDALAEAVSNLEAQGCTAKGYKCNVTNSEDVTATVKQVAKDFGGIDILVNNAGITRDTLLLRMKEEDWDAVIDINLKGTFLFSKAAARSLMKSENGRIVNISSVLGLIGNPGQVNYAASKAGVLGITRVVSKELSPRNVTVNAVAPGFIQTPMTDKLTQEQQDQLTERIPLKRLGLPADIAASVLFLASDAGAYITGQVITVDGGMVS